MLQKLIQIQLQSPCASSLTKHRVLQIAYKQQYQMVKLITSYHLQWENSALKMHLLTQSDLDESTKLFVSLS